MGQVCQKGLHAEEVHAEDGSHNDGIEGDFGAKGQDARRVVEAGAQVEEPKRSNLVSLASCASGASLRAYHL